MRSSSILPCVVLAVLLIGCGKDPTAEMAELEVGEVTTPQPTTMATTQPAPPSRVDDDDLVIPLAVEMYDILFTGVKSRLGVVESHGGGWEKIEGRIVLDSETRELDDVQVTFHMDSLWTDHDGLTKTLKENGWFEVEEHPTATFQLTDVAAAEGDGATHHVTGILDLHGVEKVVKFPITVKASDSEVHVVASFKLKRSEFGIEAGEAEDVASAVGEAIWEVHDDVGVEMDFTLQLPKDD